MRSRTSLKSTVADGSKMPVSGQNCTRVPVRPGDTRPIRLSLWPGRKRLTLSVCPAIRSLNSRRWVEPLRFTSTTSRLESAFTHRGSDAVEPPGGSVCPVAELAAGVQFGEHHLDGGDVVMLDVDRDASTTIDDLNRTVVVKRDLDQLAVPRCRFVHRVVDDLPQKVRQAARAGATDVHAGALAHGFETFEHLDRARVVGAPAAGAAVEPFRRCVRIGVSAIGHVGRLSSSCSASSRRCRCRHQNRYSPSARMR